MMISDDQGRLAAEQLKNRSRSRLSIDHPDVPREVIDAAVETAFRTPDIRFDRVAEARARIDAGVPDAHAVASKMISRLLGDALR